MNVTINHAEFGDIVYEESFWTGKKSVSINGTPLEKISKKQFRLQDGGTVTVSGNFLQGACLNLNGETIRLTPNRRCVQYGRTLRNKKRETSLAQNRYRYCKFCTNFRNLLRNRLCSYQRIELKYKI